MRTSRAGEIRFPTLHSAQRRLYDSRTGRDVWRCGRRFGKTTLLEIIGADEAIKGKQIGWFCPDYKLLSPTYKRLLKTLRPVVEHQNKVEGLIELYPVNGSNRGGTIEFWTLNNEDAGRSRAYDLVIIDEAGLVKKGLRDTWEQAIAPTLLDYGGDAIMAGTPKGIDPDNFFHTAATDASLEWNPEHMPTSANPKLDPERIAELPSKYPPLVYQQEYLADFVDWSGAAFFSRDDLIIDGDGIAYPAQCDSVFAVMDTAVKTGKENDGTAVVYYARDRFSPSKLVVLDWDIVQIEGGLLEAYVPGVFARLGELANECGARFGSLGLFIEDQNAGSILLQQGVRRGWPATPIDSDLTAKGKDERAISVSGYVFRGMVKLSGHAYNKRVNYKGQNLNHFLGQVCGFRIGVKGQSDDLLDCFAYGVAISLGDKEGH